jgi:hypothetical protein
MACYHPLTAYLMPYMVAGKFKNEISFKPCPDSNQIQLPCGQCVGCRLEKSRQWAIRCMHEAQLHEKNCFITLTYNDENLKTKSLDHTDFQKFFKRLRRAIAPAKVRYYMAGEYGTKFGRPHFHACIFGYDFHDKKLYKRTSSGSFIYRSSELEKLWTHGYSSIGDVTFESAAYIARYIMQKYTGEMDRNNTHITRDEHYTYCDLSTGELIKLQPEYNKMSLKPGIGAEWIKKYRSDVYPHDYVVINGKKTKPPRYYDKIQNNDYPFEFEEISHKREKAGKLNHEDNSYDRLAVKEQVTKAKLQLLKRTLT